MHFVHFFLCFVTGITAFSQKFAIVDIEKVVQSLPETKVAQTKLDSSISYLVRLHGVFEDSVKLIQYTVPHDGPLPVEQKLYYEMRLKKAQDNLLQFEKDAHQGLDEFRDKLYAPLRANAIKLSTIVAQAYHCSALIEKPKVEKAILYSNQAPLDITDNVVKEIIKHSSPEKK